MSGEICPVCAEGTLTEHTEPTKFKDNVEVNMIFSVCSSCGSEVTNADQSIRNKREYVKQKGFYE